MVEKGRGGTRPQGLILANQEMEMEMVHKLELWPVRGQESSHKDLDRDENGSIITARSREI